MIKIIEQGKRVSVVEFHLWWFWKDDPNAGFSFPCDADGKIFKKELAPAGLDSLRECIEDRGAKMTGPVVRSSSRSYWQAATAKCDCGLTIHLHGNTRCDCGRWFNACGQELNPPRMWGEETNERFDDFGNYVGEGYRGDSE